MRGDRPVKALGLPSYDVVGSPACAGIDPSEQRVESVTFGFPRMRGDRPRQSADDTESSAVPPHARG